MQGQGRKGMILVLFVQQNMLFNMFVVGLCFKNAEIKKKHKFYENTSLKRKYYN